MNLVDANVLLYAVNSDSPHHAVSRSWLDRALNTGEPVAFCWVVLIAFVRLSTNAAIVPRAWSAAEACDQVADWLSAPGAVVLEPTPRHLGVLRGLLNQIGASAGNITNDAHIAALAMEHGAEIVTFDNDFDRFDVRHRKPE